MFKKVSQVSNGGSTTSSLKLNISPRPLTATYFMEIKPIITNWHELLHNGYSAGNLEFILTTYFRSIPLGRTILSTDIRLRIHDLPDPLVEDLECNHSQYMADNYLEWAVESKSLPSR